MSLIKISTMSGKLKGIPAINTNTLSNGFCTKSASKGNNICAVCYSRYMLSTYRGNCVPPFEHNSRILSGDIIPVQYLPVFNAVAVRFHGHGELINDTHLINFFNICIKNPRVTFTLWTKRTSIIKSVLKWYPKPDNIILIFSNAKIDKVIKPGKFYNKTFNNVSTSKKAINCNMDCIDCLKCYNPTDKTSVIIEKVK